MCFRRSRHHRVRSDLGGSTYAGTRRCQLRNVRDVFQNSRYVFRGVPERSEHLGTERVPGTFGIRFCGVPGSLAGGVTGDPGDGWGALEVAEYLVACPVVPTKWRVLLAIAGMTHYGRLSSITLLEMTQPLAQCGYHY